MSYTLLDGRVVEDANDEKLTKRFGSTYTFFKKQHPSLHKLPENEVSEICYTFNKSPYGDTPEKAVARTNDYIKSQMPRWEKEYFNPMPATPKPMSESTNVNANANTAASWGNFVTPNKNNMFTTSSGKSLKQNSWESLGGAKADSFGSFTPMKMPKPAPEPKVPQMTPMPQMPVNTYTAQPVSYTQTQPMGFAQTQITQKPDNSSWLDTPEFDRFLNQLAEFEGRNILYPYPDTVGNATVCRGFNVQDEKVFYEQPFFIDGLNRPATLQEKKEGYKNLSLAPYGQTLDADEFKNTTNLRLSEEYCNQIFPQLVRYFYKQLQKSLPNFDRLPVPAQKAILETQFHAGNLNNAKKWPLLHKALQEMNQEEVCKNIHRKEYDENGEPILNTIKRNKWAYENCMSEPFE